MGNASYAQGKVEIIGGYETYYHEEGDGDHVLLIHGSGLGVSAWANWRLLIPQLTPKYHVFAPDLIGFGRSEKPDIAYNKEVWVNHMIHFIEEKMKPPVYIVGNSLGGVISLHLAKRRPDLVKKQVLMGTPGLAFELTEGLDIAWGSEPGIENMRRMIRIFAYNQSLAEDEELVKVRHEASIAPGVPETFAAMFPPPRQRHIDDLVLTEEELKQIETPTLALHGREDRVIPIEVSWKMAQIMPNIEFHSFPKCGHWIQIEKSNAFAEQVLGFFARE